MTPERPIDRPLHEDVRWLASALGDVIRRLEGEAAFEAVERMRQDCRARRRAEPGAPSLEALLERADALPLPLAATVARAFTLFFFLINTAEQVHRVRRRRTYRHTPDAPAQPASPRWAFEHLKAEGHGAAEVKAVLSRLEVRPVLTAHPTEATRRTVLGLQARVAEMQRLSENRFREEWVEWTDNDQKRWKQFTLSNDEVWRLHDKEFERFVHRITEVEQKLEPLGDSISRLWALERERAQLYRERYQALLLEYDSAASVTPQRTAPQEANNGTGS